MKSEFSTAWNSSSQVRKQRKYRFNAPLHIRHKFLSAHLSKELRKKYGKRSLPLRTGDEVLVMRGSFKKKKAKVVSVDVSNSRVTLEGLQRSKRDGSKVSVYFDPRVLKIEALGSEDRERMAAIARKAVGQTQVKAETEKKEPKKAKNN